MHAVSCAVLKVGAFSVPLLTSVQTDHPMAGACPQIARWHFCFHFSFWSLNTFHQHESIVDVFFFFFFLSKGRTQLKRHFTQSNLFFSLLEHNLCFIEGLSFNDVFHQPSLWDMGPDRQQCNFVPCAHLGIYFCKWIWPIRFGQNKKQNVSCS